MAFLKPKEEVPAPPPPAPAPKAPAPAAPKPLVLVMHVDGGLNGICWRAGDTVTLDTEAADFYLARGHAEVAR